MKLPSRLGVLAILFAWRREDVIQECLNALPNECGENSEFGSGYDAAIGRAREDLEALKKLAIRDSTKTVGRIGR